MKSGNGKLLIQATMNNFALLKTSMNCHCATHLNKNQLLLTCYVRMVEGNVQNKDN